MYISSLWHVGVPVSLHCLKSQSRPHWHQATSQLCIKNVWGFLFFVVCSLMPVISLYDLFSSRIMAYPGLSYKGDSNTFWDFLSCIVSSLEILHREEGEALRFSERSLLPMLALICCSW